VFAETAVACSLLISPFDEGKAIEEESECDPPDPLKVTEELREHVENSKHSPYKDETSKRYAQHLIKEREKNDKMAKELEDKEEEIKELVSEIERLKREEEEEAVKDDDGDSVSSNSSRDNSGGDNWDNSRTRITRDNLADDSVERGDDKDANINRNPDSSKPVPDDETNVSDKDDEENDEGLKEFEATFYTAMCDTGCTGTTATGIDVSDTIYTPEGDRIIAVDPSVIPLGSKVEVTLQDGSSFTASAEDTGGDIKGNRIDVLVGTKEEANKLGRQTVSIKIMS